MPQQKPSERIYQLIPKDADWSDMEFQAAKVDAIIAYLDEQSEQTHKSFCCSQAAQGVVCNCSQVNELIEAQLKLNNLNKPDDKKKTCEFVYGRENSTRWFCGRELPCILHSKDDPKTSAAE